MCGIACILRLSPGAPQPAPIPRAWIDAADAGIRHRGPDGSGVFVDRRRCDAGWADAVLIHRRLSILDHAGGAQPMLSPPPTPSPGDDTLAVVFNGCIYNHAALRSELSALGARFRTDHSDTEVLLHAYRAWGPRLTDRIEGMYALAIWDARRAELFVARDPSGEKPLVAVRIDASVWLIASTDAAAARVLRAASIDPATRLAPSLAAHVLRHPTPEPIWTDAFDLRPGRSALLRPEGDVWAWHSTSAAESPRRRIESPTPDAIDALVHAAVRDRLEADVPLACFLSGGIDSSLIAAHARLHRPDLKTFCVRMPDARYDESPHAEAIARHLGTDHTTLDVDPRPVEDLARLLGEMGLPFNDSSLLPTHWLARAVRQHAGVALSGDGGDELFGGYERYAAARLPESLRDALAALPAATLARAHPKSRWSKLERLASACRGGGYDDLTAVFPSAFTESPHTPPRWPADPLADDSTGIFPGDLLRKVDAASMSAGVEVRAPLLAPAIIAAAASARLDVLMPARPLGRIRLKALLKDALARHLPAPLFERPKSGFAIPIDDWLRADFGELGSAVRDIAASADPLSGFGGLIPLAPATVRRIADEHFAGRRPHGQRLFTLLALHLWSRWLRSVG